jgi:hypothetical protein
MTILILFHQSGYRNLKQFYLEFVCRYLQSGVSFLVSYNRFVEFERDALVPLSAYLQTRRGNAAAFHLSIRRNWRFVKTCGFRSIASLPASRQRGKTTLGWFYGFKLHIDRQRFGRAFKLASHARQHRRSASGSEIGKKTLSANCSAISVICPSL